MTDLPIRLPATVPSTFNVVDCLGGLVCLEKRSPTLDGSIPLRAAQGCTPFLDGNSAGYHVRFAEPLTLRRAPGGAVEIRLGVRERRKIVETYDASIDRMVEKGLLARRGQWARELRRGFAHEARGILRVFTGLLLRPAAGIWLLVSRAYNRRVPLDILETVLPDDQSFVPLVLEVPVRSLSTRATWVDSEVACVVPLRPGVEFRIRQLDEVPDVGRAHVEFYDREYNDRRAALKPAGRYNRLLAAAATEAVPDGRCELVVAGGPSVHGTECFRRFATCDGLTHRFTDAEALRFAVVRSACRVRGHWDGHGVREIEAEMPMHTRRLWRRWIELYGEGARDALDPIASYATYMGMPFREEPYFSILPWLFARTPAGWSSILDGMSLEGLEGMRGVIASDVYFLVPPLYRLYGPRTFQIPRRARIARLLPVPRSVLASQHTLLKL